MTVWVGESAHCIWTFISGEISAYDWDRYIEHLRSNIDKPILTPRSGLGMSYQAGVPNSAQRKQLAEFLHGNDLKLRAVRGYAFVTESSLARGALTALNWVYKKPFEEKVFSTIQGGLRWLQGINPGVDPQQVIADIRVHVSDSVVAGILEK